MADGVEHGEELEGGVEEVEVEAGCKQQNALKLG